MESTESFSVKSSNFRHKIVEAIAKINPFSSQKVKIQRPSSVQPRQSIDYVSGIDEGVEIDIAKFTSRILRPPFTKKPSSLNLTFTNSSNNTNRNISESPKQIKINKVEGPPINTVDFDINPSRYNSKLFGNKNYRFKKALPPRPMT